MGKRIGGKEFEGIIIREEGAIAEAKKSHKKNPRYVEQQLEKFKERHLTAGILSADLQESVNLKYGDLFSGDGKRLIAIAVGEAAIDVSEDKLSALVLRVAVGMGISETRRVAVFSPFEPDLRVAASLGMICVRAGLERRLGDDAGADNLTSLRALIDSD